MYVSTKLMEAGSQALVNTLTDGLGEVIIKTVNDLSGATPFDSTATGTQIAEVYNQLPKDKQMKVEQAAMYHIFEPETIATAPQSTTVVTGSQTRDYRAGIALMMAVTLTLQCFAYGAMVIWIAVMTRTIPDVSDTFVPFMVQALIVWNYNGLLTKENRDSLAAGLGAIPGGVIQTILQMVTNRRSKGTPPTA